MPQGPQNPVRQQFPQRRNDNEFGDEMESKGGETPKDSGSPPNHTAITPPPSQVAARNQQQHQQHHPPAVYRQQEGYPSKGDPNVAATTAPQAAQAHQPAAANTAEGPRPRIPQHRKRSKFSRRNIAIANGKSKNRLFAIVHPLHLAVIFFSVVAVAMIGAALGTSYWYLATAGSYYTRVGLFNQCDGNGNCQSLQFNSVTTSMCTRSGDDLKQINNAVLGLAIAGGVLSLLALILASISRCVAQVATSWIVLMATLLCTGCYAAAVGLFVAKKEGWEFCNTDFCSFIKQTQPTLTGGCDTSYGYSMGLAAVAIGSGFLSFLFALFRIIFREWNIVDESAAPAISNEELAPQNRPRAHGPTEPYPAADVSDAEPPEESAKIPPPPEGDWVYDQECGMYWSESEFLFLDPYTQHSYDPNSDMWYDPDVDEWYQGEQIDQ